MTEPMERSSPYIKIVLGVMACLGLYLTSLHSYLLFHSLAEFLSIAIECGIFFIAWNSRQFLRSNYLLFISIAYLFVAGLTLVHTLAFKGMGVFTGHDSNLAIQLWMAARYVQGGSLFVAPLLLRRNLRLNVVFATFSLLSAAILASIFLFGIFPDCYVEGVGLTRFKIESEYVICLTLLAALAMLIEHREDFEPRILRLLIWSIVFTIGSELAFTFYVDVYDLSNLIGHYFKIFSFYLVYKAIVEKGLSEPYALLFRELDEERKALTRAHDELEDRVEERTAELKEANLELLEELGEREIAEQKLRVSEELFRAIFEGASDLISIKDPSLRYTHVNPAVEQLLGLTASEIVGRTDQDLFDEQTAWYLGDADMRVLKGEIVEGEGVRMIRGVPMVFNEMRVPLRNSSGAIIGLCIISRDVTDRRTTGPLPPPTPEAYGSPAMLKALKQARHAAAKDSMILLVGESGSGKDHLARFIHEQSKRAAGPFFAINCAAVAPDLAESELFGHERGAFTGAHGRKRGLLELAESGTLLLNEIGELSLPLQAKLLSFLDAREFTRVGGQKTVSVNARLIAATNRNLEKAVAEGRFRQDLFYRLNVISIVVPPLRDRTKDIPLIAKEILSDLAAEMKFTHIPHIDESGVNFLCRYHWPGNVRELRNVLERALMLWDGEQPNLTLPELEVASEDWSKKVSLKHGRTLRVVTDEITEVLCVEALQRSKGNKKEAAQLLGIARDSLYRYMRQFGLESDNRSQ